MAGDDRDYFRIGALAPKRACKQFHKCLSNVKAGEVNKAKEVFDAVLPSGDEAAEYSCSTRCRNVTESDRAYSGTSVESLSSSAAFRSVFGSHRSNWAGILRDQSVRSEKCNTLHSCLCNEYPIEWILVNWR